MHQTRAANHFSLLPSAFCLLPSYVEKDLLDMNDVLEIEDPAQNHLDGQREHDQEQVRTDVVARRAHLQIEAAERTFRGGGCEAEVEQDQAEAEGFADDAEIRQRHRMRLDPDKLR